MSAWENEGFIDYWEAQGKTISNIILELYNELHEGNP